MVGSEIYTIWIHFDSTHTVKDYDCNCPAFSSYYHGMCKHIVAVLKVMQAHWEVYFGKEKSTMLTQAAQEMLAFFNQDSLALSPYQQLESIRIVPTYAFSLDSRGQRSWLEFMIGNEQMYVMKDIPQFLTALDAQQEIVYGKYFTLQPGKIGLITNQSLYSIY